MKRARLSETLTALAEGATPDHPGLTVTEAEIDLPLIVSMEAGPDGPEFVAHPPWSAFRSGFEPIVHRARLTIHGVQDEAPETATPAAGLNGVT